MKAIAKDIVVQNYSLVVDDDQLVLEQQNNEHQGMYTSDDRLRRVLIQKRIVQLIGDEKRKSSFFIYDGTVRHLYFSHAVTKYYFSSVIITKETSPIEQ